MKELFWLPYRFLDGPLWKTFVCLFRGGHILSACENYCSYCGRKAEWREQ